MNPVSPSVHLRRSFLYVPGSEEKKLAKAAALGFVGKQAIHPGQLPIIHDAFTPSAERVRRAERVLEAWRQAQAEGRGVIALDGDLIELPVVAMEQRVLERARRASRVGTSLE